VSTSVAHRNFELRYLILMAKVYVVICNVLQDRNRQPPDEGNFQRRIFQPLFHMQFFTIPLSQQAKCARIVPLFSFFTCLLLASRPYVRVAVV